MPRNEVPYGLLLVEVGMRETPAEIRKCLVQALSLGSVHAVGRDCRTLQRLVLAAGMEGLEVRDLDGYLIAATRRLRAAHDAISERRRLRLRWCVEVHRHSESAPVGTGYVVQRHTSVEGALRVWFSPGTLVYLREGEIA